MIKFKSITIEGFGSIIGPITITFAKRGLIIIKGPNGVGKTTILSALTWCIYGKPIKPNATVQTYDHLRGDLFKGTKVTLALARDDKQYTFIRCQEYKGKIGGVQGKNRVIVYEGDTPKYDKVREANAYILKVIGLSFELFKASIIFGQKMKRLIEEDGPSKKKVLEEAFNILYIEKAKGLANDKLAKALKEYNAVNIIVSGLEGSKYAKEHEIERLEKLETTFETDKQNKVKELKVELKEWESKYTSDKIKVIREEIEESERFTVKYRNKIKAVSEQAVAVGPVGQRLAKSKADKKQAKLDLSDYEDKKQSLLDNPTKCPYCGGNIDNQTYREKIAELSLGINTCKKSIEICNKAIIRHKKEVASAEKLHTKLELTNKKLNIILENITTLKGLKKDLENAFENITRLHKEIKEEKEKKPTWDIKVVKEELTLISNDLEHQELLKDKWSKKVDIYRWAIDKPLSNSGLKSFIFNQMVQKLNKQLSKYSSYINFRPYFEIDMESARKDVNIMVYNGEYPVPFADLSGGQGQLVNVVTAFAVHDIVAQDTFNILILDEVFESLSENNVEIISGLIEQKARDKAIYLITHLSGFAASNSTSLELTSLKGITQTI